MASSRRLPTSYNESTYGSGQDYTVLATWEAATDNDLVTATDGEILTCKAGLYDDSIVLGGATTNSSYFRVIRADDGARGTTTSGVRFAQSTVSNTINVGENYAGIYDIAAKSTRNAAGTSAGIVVAGVNYVKIVGCTAYECDNPTTNAVGFFFYNLGATNLTGYIVNCVAKDNGPNSIGYGVFAYKASTGTLTLSVYNTTTTGNNYGLYNYGSTCYLKNAITQSNTNNTFGTWTATTCITSGATFESDGYHLAYNDTTAYDSGTDLSSDGTYAFDDDIDGDTRSGDWDIGCDERIDSITLDETTDDLADRRVIAYDADEEGAVELTGIYSRSAGAPTHIQARVFNRTTTNTVQIDSSDWTTLTSETISGGSWSGTLSGIPKTNAWLGFEVRFSNETGVTDTGSNKIGVGYVVLYFGQSYIDSWVDSWPHDNEDAYKTSNDLCSKFRHLKTGQGDNNEDAYTGWVLNTGDGSVPFADKLQDELNCPIGLLAYGMSGSALLEENKYLTSGFWVGDSASDNWLEDVEDGVEISEPLSRRKFNSAIWYQGFTDCNNAVTYQDYYDGMESLFASIRTASNFSSLPIFVIGQPTADGSTFPNDASYADVREAQIDICDDDEEVKNIFGGQAIDQPMYTDDIHLSQDGQESEALRYAQSVLWFELGTGNYTYHRGPKNVRYELINNTTTDVIIEHDGGTDFTPTSGIDSYEVKISGSWYSSTGARVSSTKVRLTHTSGTVESLRCLYGNTPTVTNCLRDNTALALPIEVVQDFIGPGYQNYTKGDYATLPTDDTDLETDYTTQNYTDVETDDATRVAQTATSEYAIHEFKDYVGTDIAVALTWNGQTDLAPSSSTVYLQAYNQTNEEWDTIDSDSTSSADTDFNLTGNISDLTDYKDVNNLISCRVYQLDV